MYDHKKIEPSWQKIWQDKKTFKVDLKKAKKPFYNLVMFPYPSAEGLHVGHIVPYSGTDTYGRFMKMSGFDVFEPMGFDAFGIHSENFAIKKGLHPADLIKKTTDYFKNQQMKKLGTLFDWDNSLSTTDPNYYKWTQWIFIQLFNANLAYKKKAPVTYCPSCQTVLADEQTETKDGKTVCERCKTEITKKNLSQWFFSITKYADRLLKNLPKIDWPYSTKLLQKNWIGKSQGIEITYQVENSNNTITCFTTRPDTNFGATFIVLAPEHPLVEKITTKENKKQVGEYIKKSASKTEYERISETHDKTGVFTGSYAANNLTKEKMPIYISDFVILSYGTGAVVGVPGHDLRDFEFAKKFALPIKRVVIDKDKDASPITSSSQVHQKEGVMINSQFLNGLDSKKAINVISKYLIEKGWAKHKTTYRLRDWCISRQRYWGPPIPMINCPKCGWVPEDEKNLPLVLPELNDYQPDKSGKSPLSKLPRFVNTTCPKCGGKAKRETDVSDTFLDSAWYFFRYLDPQDKDIPFPTKKIIRKYQLDKDPYADKWFPVASYIGGNEHACMHLLYARFITMVFKDLSFIDFEEPFKKLYAHGLIIKDGAKMSKSRGNVVDPTKYIDKYGADTLRLYILFLGPYSAGGDFRDSGISGTYKFLSRIYHLVDTFANQKDHNKPINIDKKTDKDLTILKNKTIKAVTNDLNNLKFNTAIARIMEYYNAISKHPTPDNLKTLLLLLAPLTPHLTEDLWQKINHHQEFTNASSIHSQSWPTYNEKLVKDDKIIIAVQVNGKLRDTIKTDQKKANNQKHIKDLALASDKVIKHLKAKKPKKTIYVRGKIINFVV